MQKNSDIRSQSKKSFGINKVALTLDIQVGHFPKNTSDNLAMAFVSPSQLQGWKMITYIYLAEIEGYSILKEVIFQ